MYFFTSHLIVPCMYLALVDCCLSATSFEFLSFYMERECCAECFDVDCRDGLLEEWRGEFIEMVWWVTYSRLVDLICTLDVALTA